MKIAVFHNYYKQRGGEDAMFELEVEALQSIGHTVVTYTVHNEDAFKQNTLLQKISGALNAPHSRSSEQSIRAFLKEHLPDVSHVHNWFPIISPSIYTAHESEDIPVVQTLHNYRLGCAAANYQLKGENCHACTPDNNRPAINNSCYNNSLAGSLAWKRVMDRGWKNGTFTNKVSQYISPSNEVLKRHVEMGIPANKITYIPNACPDPETSKTGHSQLNETVQNVCFVGRFAPEKGTHILIRAWQEMLNKYETDAQLTLIGSGPQDAHLRELAKDIPSIRFTGQLNHIDTLHTLKQAQLLVCPGLWAEPFGLSVIEAMGAKTPVISSALGGPAEIISNGKDGTLLPAGDYEALTNALIEYLRSPEKVASHSHAARQKYVENYTPKAHVKRLTDCFEALI